MNRQVVERIEAAISMNITALEFSKLPRHLLGDILIAASMRSTIIQTITLMQEIHTIRWMETNEGSNLI